MSTPNSTPVGTPRRQSLVVDTNNDEKDKISTTEINEIMISTEEEEEANNHLSEKEFVDNDEDDTRDYPQSIEDMVEEINLEDDHKYEQLHMNDTSQDSNGNENLKERDKNGNSSNEDPNRNTELDSESENAQDYSKLKDIPASESTINSPSDDVSISIMDDTQDEEKQTINSLFISQLRDETKSCLRNSSTR